MARTALRIAVASLLALLVTAPSVAGAQSTESSQQEPFSLAALGLKGILTFKNFSHFSESPNDDQNFRNEGNLQVEWARSFAPWGGVKIVVETRKDDNDLSEGVTFRIPETGERRGILNLKEAVLRLQQSPVEVTLGKQIFAWGTADSFNPTDYLNPYDYLDVIDNEKLAVYSAAIRLTTGPTNLTFVLVPFFTPSRTPLPNSRWVPPPPEGRVAVVEPRDLPPRDVDNMQYAVRLRTTTRGWDLSASYFDGFEDTPVLRLSTADSAAGGSLLRVTPVFTRIRAAGLDFSTTYKKLELHGEGVFKLVERNGREDRFQGVVGLNYAWDELDVRWLERITLVLEYGREAVLSSKADPTLVGRQDLLSFGVPVLDDAFRDGLFARLVLKFNDETQLNLSGAMDLSRGTSQYVQLKLTHKLTDALHVDAGLDLFAGGRDTFWGRWRDNNRFFVFLRYFF